MVCTYKYNKSLKFDPANPKEVLDVLKKTIDCPDFNCDEQKLFCIGYILDSNKEKFITHLKKEKNEYKEKSIALEGEIEKLRKTVESLKKQQTGYSKQNKSKFNKPKPFYTPSKVIDTTKHDDFIPKNVVDTTAQKLGMETQPKKKVIVVRRNPVNG